MDYPMCSQTVTVYRKTPEGVERAELSGCYIQWENTLAYDRLGKQTERKFLLIQPGERQQAFPGDRVMEGIGPEITLADWPGFIPERVDGLGEVAYAKTYCRQGIFCHTEAGRK